MTPNSQKQIHPPCSSPRACKGLSKQQISLSPSPPSAMQSEGRGCREARISAGVLLEKLLWQVGGGHHDNASGMNRLTGGILSGISLDKNTMMKNRAQPWKETAVFGDKPFWSLCTLIQKVLGLALMAMEGKARNMPRGTLHYYNHRFCPPPL